MTNPTSPPVTAERACVNTDRELWRETEGDYYANSIHVTAQGGIGINVGGSVIVKPLADWHSLAMLKERATVTNALAAAKMAFSIPFTSDETKQDALERIDAAIAILDTPVGDEVVERVARAICAVDECGPDSLEPGDTPFGDDRQFFDGTVGVQPAYFLWRNYVCAARAAIDSLGLGIGQ